MKTIIVGAGAISYCHAEALTKLGVEIEGVFDINPESSQKLAEKYNTKVIHDLTDHVKDVDLVHICTPPAFRIPYAEIAMNVGCHVMMEKPMAISMEDGKKLVEISARNNVQLMIDFNHRFRKGFDALMDVVKSGKIGDPINVFVQRLGMLGGNTGTQNDTWRKNKNMVCGMTIESLAHDIDMIVQLTGKVTKVKSFVESTFHDLPEFDNNASISFKTEQNVIGTLNASWSSHIKGSTRGVVGTKGTVMIEGDDLFNYNTLRLQTDGMENEQVVVLDDIYHFETCPSYFNANKHFIESIQNETITSASGEYALEILKVSHAILQSDKESNVVTIS